MRAVIRLVYFLKDVFCDLYTNTYFRSFLGIGGKSPWMKHDVIEASIYVFSFLSGESVVVSMERV